MNLTNIPEELLYRRNHFAYPTLQEEAYRITIQGAVSQPRVFDNQTIRSLPSRNVHVVLECAGNKRAFFEPKTFGEQWERGAWAQGVWTGVPLSELLRYAGMKPSAQEVVAEGWDMGRRHDMPGIFPFARSIPVATAMHPDTLLAYAYNGSPLSPRHGFPYRLIVPRWYAMASVKWVRRIFVTESPFQGPFQSIDYQYYPDKTNPQIKYPVTIQHVNSSILTPRDRSIMRKGRHAIHGTAWTGLGEIDRVEISVDGGTSWREAKIERPTDRPHGWVLWRYDWDANQAGEYSILSRARDTSGRIQPMRAYWNRKGYGYNAADRIKILIE
ncbi:sulfite oxidase [Cohnella candidum]|nr:sulfite oxidase [Cohnella candidum]